jgi:hypothetical protein
VDSLLELMASDHLEPTIRVTIVITLGDLFIQFTNLIEARSEKIWGLLRCKDPLVKLNALNVIANLINIRFLKSRKGEIVDIILLCFDEDQDV